jgi:energy-coupling factor transport system ATP-binding protein
MNIEILNVNFYYDKTRQVLSDINLYIPSGTSIALVGCNGCGKTTLARCINGILHPQTGNILIGENDSRGSSTASLSHFIGCVFQNPDDQLFHRRVIDEVKFGPRNLRYKPEKVEELAQKALIDLGLLPYAETNPHDLGYSQRKMVTLASAIAMDTPIFVLDEPTMGMDNGEVRQVKRVLVEMKEKKKTVFMITHDMELAAETVERIIVMNNGRIVIDGSPHEVFGSHLLHEWGLLAPQMVRLSQRLNLNDRLLTVEDFIRTIAKEMMEKISNDEK